MVLFFSLDQLGVDFEVLLTNCTITGIIESVAVLADGTGYTEGETVDLVGVTSGAISATATVTVAAGVVQTITIVDGADDYTDGETVTLTGQTSGQSDATGIVTTTTNYNTSSIDTVTIEFTKPDGSKLSKDADLITDPDDPTQKLIQYRNIPPEASILDLRGEWEYGGGAVLVDTSNFETTERTVFWVI